MSSTDLKEKVEQYAKLSEAFDTYISKETDIEGVDEIKEISKKIREETKEFNKYGAKVNEYCDLMYTILDNEKNRITLETNLNSIIDYFMKIKELYNMLDFYIDKVN